VLLIVHTGRYGFKIFSISKLVSIFGSIVFSEFGAMQLNLNKLAKTIYRGSPGITVSTSMIHDLTRFKNRAK
jgi:hypothetical protein